MLHGMKKGLPDKVSRIFICILYRVWRTTREYWNTNRGNFSIVLGAAKNPWKLSLLGSLNRLGQHYKINASKIPKVGPW